MEINKANSAVRFIKHCKIFAAGESRKEGVEEEAKGCEGHDGDELADERAEVHEVEGEIALEEHTEEEGDETEDVQHNDDGNACEPNQGSFL